MVLYEYDLGLHSFQVKEETPAPEDATGLMSVREVGGVVILCEGRVIYRNRKRELTCALPLPLDRPKDRTPMVICHTPVKTKDRLFYLLQTELGDVMQLSFETSEGKVSSLSV